MDEQGRNGASNGAASGWIPFGDRPNQVFHPDTAAAVLRLLYEDDKARFGRYVALALTGEPPRGGARSARAPGP